MPWAAASDCDRVTTRRRYPAAVPFLSCSIATGGANESNQRWTDSTASVPCTRLVAEPLPELRARVAMLTTAKRPVARVVPPTDGAGEAELTPRERAMIDELSSSGVKIDPVKYLADKAKKKAVL